MLFNNLVFSPIFNLYCGNIHTYTRYVHSTLFYGYENSTRPLFRRFKFQNRIKTILATVIMFAKTVTHTIWFACVCLFVCVCVSKTGMSSHLVGIMWIRLFFFVIFFVDILFFVCVRSYSYDKIFIY